MGGTAVVLSLCWGGVQLCMMSSQTRRELFINSGAATADDPFNPKKKGMPASTEL